MIVIMIYIAYAIIKFRSCMHTHSVGCTSYASRNRIPRFLSAPELRIPEFRQPALRVDGAPIDFHVIKFQFMHILYIWPYACVQVPCPTVCISSSRIDP